MITRDLIGTKLLIRQTRGQAFNLDTVLLADFVRIPKGCRLIYDYGTGNGGLMLYLSQKTNAKLIGLEIQEHRYNDALYNIKLNNLENQISVINDDILSHKLEKFADCIVTNPPFFKINNNTRRNKVTDQEIARHEVAITLDGLIEKIAKGLNNNGLCFMIHRPERLDEIISTFNKYKMAVKKIRFIHPSINKEPNHVLIEAAKMAKGSLRVLPPLILYQDKHVYSEELELIYGGRSYVTTNT